MTTVINISRLSKRFILSHQNRPDSLKAWVLETIKHRAGVSRQQPQAEEFWALRDISLEVKEGECLALIGCNGSGKSTLLKILSRIIPPTSGSIELHGRTASLLEVGTGFHPELTGRENIFLNGAMLGCTNNEIKQRFDSIVDFSGVERFIDTPVKHYSSGMYVRLAYSVAAHVDADILVIDEVLAVGDESFRKKCLDHISKVIAEKKTCLMVSHGIEEIRRLATRVAWLDKGCLREISPIDSGILDRYTASAE